ncbi:MAG TPA: TonB-dependent receptor, partial [Vicinamibacterales bacterium]|nr:TonB-dependent receptor [Vicinamibacterales bacterium]
MLAVALLLALAQAPAASSPAITGVVVDTSGAPIPGARVTLSTQGRTGISVATGDDGTFALANGPAARVTLLVSAPGFTDETVILDSRSDIPVRIELRPRGLTETVTVSANPSELRVTTPASATVFDVEMLATMPAWTLDDQLRTVPGFSLFRRSSSRVANPTTQGATLRGLSASGASRTLVLADGVPLNDPFGGWVYWDRVPAAALHRVEVARGGSSDLHGSDALGGAIRLETAGGSGARLLLDGGTSGTARGSAYGGRDLGSWRIFAAGEAFNTDGFVIVAPEARGPIDTPAASRHASVYGGTSRTFQ